MDRLEVAREIAEKMIDVYGLEKSVEVLTEEIYEILNRHAENY